MDETASGSLAAPTSTNFSAEQVAARVRLGLCFVGATLIVVWLIDYFGGDPDDPRLSAIRAVQFAAVAAGLWEFRSRRAALPRPNVRILIILSCILVTMALEGVSERDAVTAPTLTTLIVLGAAVLVPWQAQSQVALAVLATFCIAALVLSLRSQAQAQVLGDPLAASLVAFISSVVVTQQLERRRQEAALAQAARLEEEKRFRTLVQNSSDIVTVVGRDGRIEYIGPSVTRILGYSPAEMVGTTSEQYIYPDDRAAVGAAFASILAFPGASTVVESRTRSKDGSWIWFESVICNLLDDPTIRGIVGNARDITARKRTEREQQHTSAQLRALSERLRSVREEESTRIARTIHDELGQALTGLKLDLGWLQRQLTKGNGAADVGAAVDRVRSLSGTIDGVIERVRAIASDLRPGILDAMGLPAAIEWQASEFERRTGVATTVSVSPIDIKVDPTRSTAIFRILQEILTNVARHAEAQRVTIDLSLQAGLLVLAVRDDGRGIPDEMLHDPRSLGLLGMRERALALGGRCEFEGEGAQGTCVRVRIPVPSPTDSAALHERRFGST